MDPNQVGPLKNLQFLLKSINGKQTFRGRNLRCTVDILVCGWHMYDVSKMKEFILWNCKCCMLTVVTPNLFQTETVKLLVNTSCQVVEVCFIQPTAFNDVILEWRNIMHTLSDVFLVIVLFLRWSGDSTGGVVSEAGSVPHPVRGGGKGLPPCPRTAPAAHCLLELPREWRRHQVRTLITRVVGVLIDNYWLLKSQVQLSNALPAVRCFFPIY